MINRIDGPSSVRPTSGVRRAGKTSSAGSSSFSNHLDESEETTGVSGTGSLGAVNSVLDLQEVDDALDRAARGKLRAEDLLDTLDDLKMDILTGRLSPSKLKKLSETVQSRREEVSDPKLNEILDEIDLRAQVELAKFTRT